ncbi:DNA/RNA nuclease SfsA [Ruminiclostridium cellulolyticum]|uniref:Sugar fermentation stimulation protein homolog n=1 Tax=Ruminiclostridium cellulolyticum (strain ATCC 35319 / DSM 5812 / JCM 6584 / H10) TaxID=394503 RepID=SFSA_RUMCH|nr:DNA/RNA nuclease SfsA [Ruminiclostridium cellulolyticum]B8I298.1 RecName: Full=Sugar fermentation stimulation protein homolog [Ruminiclostridium cellulolyticum H10]ACL77761.1 sugar fermentation stimulation protein [Ruminiclostridium cellulolyticum H10]
MKYKNIKRGIFIERPNRFIAHVEIDSVTEICHVKNTGRCKELLIPGTVVYIQKSDNPKRKTGFDLISVIKGSRHINMDSQAPNKLVQEWMEKGNLFSGITLVKAESRYKNSRFDFYVETKEDKIFIEVKGVTLEENNIAMFPDAPTERGVRHIKELCDSLHDGYKAYIIFVIQMKDVDYFIPNETTHREFSDALKSAYRKGVNILALDCVVEEGFIEIEKQVEVRL